MYAIVEIAGQQFKVEKNQKLFVHRLEGAEGDSVSFDRVLLIDNDGQVSIGTPTIEEASISAKILKHLKGDKVIVFKKKRRKGYAVKNGHRQLFTQIQITAISLIGMEEEMEEKKEVVMEMEEIVATGEIGKMEITEEIVEIGDEVEKIEENSKSVE